MPARRKHFNNRFNPTPRARSQRKKIKKSLGPDFLDPSDLGYGYLKDTYDPKCYVCDFQLSSGRSEKHITCKKCNLKVHRRCLVPDESAENIFSFWKESDWTCEDCTTICSICGKKNLLYKKNCSGCGIEAHTVCIQQTKSVPDLENGEWTCKKCKDPASEKSDEENFTSCYNLRDALCDTIPLRTGKSLTVVASNLHHTDKIRKPSSEESLIDSLSIPELPEELESNLNNEIEPSKAEIADYHDYVSNRLAKMVKDLDMDPDPQNWTTDDVEAYVKEIGFPDQAHLFKEQLIDGRSLLLLRRMDVVKGLSMKLGPALKIYAHINQLQEIDLGPAFNSLQSSQSSDNLNQI